ncbi:hypothetical protein APY04_1044 [Hyphomicrobium sulfonivorans]|uniref:Uncharacterized protein n=1 Tax=Hyphomicrobium sulfonivorans TaxID=121290 RepID=A0A109BLU2_HYPSL|nr:hypothetical protein APY04_1044 [Hyphomicrobium sulfonivorans]
MPDATLRDKPAERRPMELRDLWNQNEARAADCLRYVNGRQSDMSAKARE